MKPKPKVKNKLTELLSESKKFKVQAMLVLEYKKRKGPKIFHSSVDLIYSDLDIDKAFKFIHQSIKTKIKNYVREDRIVSDVIKKHSIKIFDCA